ncbi:DUF368 domain-containing protein [Halovivax gelatinilyticus]|uniref:DUF368 domain-containing protein n=1 Tax=Halovivax gelatinilyticus TaxID=2961597 RepID=UPI0020CA501F|nr:DUF368 domain-containing protein [Halovivax gelatinilyticus]
MREGLVVYCKGFAMGAADAVPGVSGATIALIVGIYDRMIRAITAIDPRELREISSRDGRAALWSELLEWDLPFLLALGLGAVSAVVVLANAMAYLTEAHPVPTYAFFTGLIAASAIVLYSEVDVTTPKRVLVAAGGIVLAAAVTGVTATGASHTLPIVFVTGAIAICAMVLPGISGAFFLLVLGQYEYLTGVLSDFTSGVAGLFDGNSVGTLVEPGTVIAVFGAGAVLGLFTMAHAVRVALDRYHTATMTFLVSLMVGALRLPIEEVAVALGESSTGSPSYAILGGSVGAGIVLLADRYAIDRTTVSNPA